MLTWRPRGNAATYQLADPFAINPIRRSFVLVGCCAAAIFGPALAGDEVLTVAMLSVGWLAISGIVIGTPILVWSLAEEAIRLLRRRWRPTVDLLDLSPRLIHVLNRHGFETIEEIDRAADADLLMLSNMDRRGLQETRRAIAIWKYRRWQDQGFPATND
ncbi:MAG: DNA-directed RNA polymerase subunit alpha C-terminal domain-containing protein [Thermomicrobiales bacterium]